MAFKNKDISASELGINDVQRKHINKIVNDLKFDIFDEIREGYENGLHTVKSALPINFSINNMKNKAAQRVIYYKLLRILLDRGFDVKIDLKKDTTFFIISWFSQEELEEQQEQSALLAKYTINSKESSRKSS